MSAKELLKLREAFSHVWKKGTLHFKAWSTNLNTYTFYLSHILLQNTPYIDIVTNQTLA